MPALKIGQLTFTTDSAPRYNAQTFPDWLVDFTSSKRKNKQQKVPRHSMEQDHITCYLTSPCMIEGFMTPKHPQLNAL